MSLPIRKRQNKKRAYGRTQTTPAFKDGQRKPSTSEKEKWSRGKTGIEESSERGSEKERGS